MNVQEQINKYIADQVPSKREDMQILHRIILNISPNCKLWFIDGKNSDNKIVSNPNVGYGLQSMSYANGDSRTFYQIGMSANTTGISIYLMGIADRKYLAESYGGRIGKAKVTGYCVKFRSMKDVNIGILEEMIANHMNTGPKRGMQTSP